MRAAKRPRRFVLVDGYNIIHAWGYLSAKQAFSLEAARTKLIGVLQNYQGFTKYDVILVFDAHLVKGGVGEITVENGVTVVYTKEAETADSYIERVSRGLCREYSVTVATSDNLEQIIILGSGAARLSANDFLLEVQETERAIAKRISAIRPIKNNQLIDNLDPKTAKILEDMRM
ncbi:hypothetical protein FACS189490_06480 [Clostridia bacterium]|nr:hypothetical protein FACS189490_06480 [Clostridia bacterium]